MTTTELSAELARGWIEAWIRMDIEPLARKSVQELTIKEVIESGSQAAIWFENQKPNNVQR